MVFGPKPRSYAKDLNRKTAKLALWRALSDKVKGEQLLVLDDVTVSQPKTKMLAALLKGLKVDKALVVVDQISRELALASRNIPGLEVVAALNLNSLQVVKYPKILISKAALEQVQIRLEVAQEKAS